jgi:hypothetical protein
LKNRLKAPLLAGFLLFFGAGISAQADSIDFTFNSLASGVVSSQANPNNNTASNSIQGYMNSVLGCANCVTVTGAVADKTYNGEGYVTGPGTGRKSLTLGTSDGATASNSNSTVNSSYDTFIANTNDSSHQVSNQITMKFIGTSLSGPISFDFEIFPDGTANQPPDFEFVAKDINGNVLASFVQLGATPGTTDGTAKHSPNHQGSGNTNKEPNKQWIGTYTSPSLTGVTELDFIDWPATIAVDDLVITRSTVPEPGSMILLGTGLATLFCLTRKKLKA